MAPYSPPTGGRAGKLRLDFNENTVGCSPAVTAALGQKLDAGTLAVYPEYATRDHFLDARLRERVARLIDSEGFVRPDLEVWRHW